MNFAFDGMWGARRRVRPCTPGNRRGLWPRTEALEQRTLFATFHWDGGSAVDSNWATPQNWAGDVAPAQNDHLVFPGGAARTTNTNNYPAGTRFQSITFSGAGYSVDGNRIDLQLGLTASHPTGVTTFNVPLRIVGPGPVAASFAGTTLTVGGAVENLSPLNAGGSGTVRITGVVSGNGIVKGGPGTLSLSGNNT